MSKIYLFLPDFKALIKNTSITNEAFGFSHDVFYYEDDTWIYFYKPIGSFVYCFETAKAVEVDGIMLEGKTQEELDELKRLFNAIEVPRMLYISQIITHTTGEIKQ